MPLDGSETKVEDWQRQRPDLPTPVLESRGEHRHLCPGLGDIPSLWPLQFVCSDKYVVRRSVLASYAQFWD